MDITKEHNDKEKNRLLDSLNNILQNSMDEYVDEQELSIPSDRDDLIYEINKIIQIAPACCRKNEKFLSEISSKAEYKKNKKFLDWLQRYVDSINKPYELFLFLNDYSIYKFKEVSQYCMENTILKVVSKEKIEEYQCNYAEIFKIRDAMLFTARLMLCKNYSDELVKNEINKLFGVNDEQSNIWLKIISDNSDALWKCLLMQKIEKIEERLDNY